MVVKLAEQRLANRSMLFAPDGSLKATYDKIHMFDVDLVGGESYRESNTYQPGEKAVAVDLPWGKLGMTVCYDMRFPYLYRELAHAGADFLTVPSAFTVPTGRAHWHVLLRSRAIETGCFVIAAAQVGDHFPKRRTYGHSIIISPWGEVLAEREENTPGIITAEIDVGKVKEARQMVPSLFNDRAYTGLKPAVRDAAE
jgi:predicted amidohydrolase